MCKHKNPAINWDMQLFTVIIKFNDTGELSTVETPLDAMTKHTLYTDLIDGQYETGGYSVEKIFAYNPVQGTCEDVTEELAQNTWHGCMDATERLLDVPEFIMAHHPDTNEVRDYFAELEQS